MAKKLHYAPKELIISTGDTHIYSNHLEQARTQVRRMPMPQPQLVVSDAVISKDWSEIMVDDFELIGYLCHPAIRAEMAV
jgi:thymidylate synthase